MEIETSFVRHYFTANVHKIDTENQDFKTINIAGFSEYSQEKQIFGIDIPKIVIGSSIDRKCFVFTTTPYITTLDFEHDHPRVKITNIKKYTLFQRMALNKHGSLLAIIDNKFNILILQRITKVDKNRSEILADRWPDGYDRSL